MRKIVAFIASPRKNGFSTQLVEEAIKGAESKGAEVKIYDLNNDGAKGCQGCFYCRANEGCATQDYLQPMYEDIKNADGIIVGSPIYFGGISSQLKKWLDRMFPMMSLDFKPRFPGKKVVSIFTYANPDIDIFKNNIEAFNKTLPMFGWNVTDSLVCCKTGSPDFKISDELLKQAYTAGVTLSE